MSRPVKLIQQGFSDMVTFCKFDVRECFVPGHDYLFFLILGLGNFLMVLA